ncbi:MFS transporter [Thiospirochaeta perfilievii]|uniref:MFS transporter n=1 Tax=Thiospirochaeta perfilievii TaxID=252967 RepID=A0A5C1QCU9_9SPIO|nr:OFA family MFS transporter [Thiospirochaeta perfilievii]QEN05237.1 MFS transporter [Thiospirochaeta perfilievii]
MKMKNQKLIILFGAVLMQISIGAIYSWTLFNEALHNKFNWDISDILLTNSLIIFVFAFTTMFSGRLLDRFGSRIIGTIGGILYGLGLILTSRADTLIELYLFYGVIAGIGVGFVYVCPLATCIKWFPKKKGLVTGIAIGAFGMGSLIFKTVIEALIINKGVSQSFLWLGMIYLILTVTGSRLLKEPSKSHSDKHKENNSTLYTVRTMVKTKNFYFIWFSYLLACIGGLLLISSAVEVGLNVAHVTFTQATSAVIIISIFNTLGRLFWGIISDKIGCRLSAMLMFILSALALFTISLIPINIFLFYFLIAIITFCFGGFLVIYPTITSEYFGLTNLGRNYGLVYQAYGVAALIGPILLKHSNSYTTPFIITGITSIIGLILISQIRK